MSQVMEITMEIRKYFVQNHSENTTYPNLWDTGKAVLRRVLITLKA